MKDFNEALDELKDNHGLDVQISGDDLRVVELSPVQLKVLLEHPTTVSVAVGIFRPGGVLFERYLELKYYHPWGEREKLLRLVWFKFDTIVFHAVIVPRDEESNLHNAAAYAKVELHKGLVVATLSAAGMKELPFNPTYQLIQTKATPDDATEKGLVAELEAKYLPKSKPTV